jgi:hypothetical protein
VLKLGEKQKYVKGERRLDNNIRTVVGRRFDIIHAVVGYQDPRGVVNVVVEECYLL